MKRLLAAGFLLLAVVACKDSPSAPPVLTNLDITDRERFVLTGDTVQLSARGTTAGGTPATTGIQWESLLPGVATVNATTGVVTGVSRGKARIVARSGSGADTAAVSVIRSTFNINADQACENPEQRSVRIAAVTQRTIILADVQNPSGGFTDQEYRSFGEQFDNTTYPTITSAFGEPADVDDNGRVIVLYSRAVNDLTESVEDGYVGGFFFGRDLFPRTRRNVLGLDLGSCAGSNEAEMMYMLVPEPARGGPYTKERVKQNNAGVLAHEFQHLINASRRLFVVNAPGNNWIEETWLNEGLSHIAEELMFYAVSGLAPGQNINLDRLRSSTTILDAVNAYQVPNLVRMGIFYEDPETNSPFDIDDLLEARGAAWQFLRYSADRRGGSQSEFWHRLVNNSATGLGNLQGVLGTEPLPWLRDWTVSMYADDVVPLLQSRFVQPSWNFRSILPVLFDDEFPLSTRALQSNTPVQVGVRSGSAAYFRFGVDAGVQASVRVAAGGDAAPETCTGNALNLAVGEVYTGAAGEVETLCVGGGTAGADYTLIPFHASTAVANLLVSISATGVRAAAGPPNPSLGFARSPAFSSLRLQGEKYLETPPHDRWHERLRETERRELSPLVPGGATATHAVSRSMAAATGPLMVSLVRTR